VEGSGFGPLLDQFPVRRLSGGRVARWDWVSLLGSRLSCERRLGERLAAVQLAGDPVKNGI